MVLWGSAEHGRKSETGDIDMLRSSAAARVATLASVVGLACGVAHGQSFDLQNVAEARGILPVDYQSAPGMIAGIAAVDYNGDGHVDIFVPNTEGLPDLMYVNNGDGTFTEAAADLGIDGGDGAEKPRSRVALWLDYDGDRRLDLLVLGDSFFQPMDDIKTDWAQPRLFRQLPDGTFENVSEPTGMNAIDMLSDHRAFDPGSTAPQLMRHFGSVAAGDLNGDGYPDLMIGLWQALGENDPDEVGGRLLLNQPDGSGGRVFEDVTIDVLAPGVAEPGLDHFGSFWQIVMHDFNGDGLLDMYAAIDMDHNHLWLNQGSYEDPTRPGVMLLNPMEDVTFAAGATSPTLETDMGVTLGDVDNNGLMDIYITTTDTPGSGINNTLFVAQSTDPTFVDQSVSAGVAGNQFGWGWGTTFQDMDRDGWVDLLVTNGFNSCTDQPRMMINDGTPMSIGFTEQASDALNRVERGSTIIGADFDRDGDIDLAHTIMMVEGTGCAVAAVHLLDNQQDVGAVAPSWLTVRPRMAGPNTHAIGARVRVELTGGLQDLDMIRVLKAGVSMGGQEPAEAHFGLGADIRMNDLLRITITWPDGSTPTVIEGTAGALANQVLHVGPCSVVDVAEPYGSLDLFDALEYLNRFSAGDMSADLVAPFGSLDFFDALEAFNLIEDGCP